MIHTSPQLKSRVMRRVYLTWFRKTALPFVVGEFAILAIVIGGMESYVSFAKIMQNIELRTLSTLGHYFITAFGHAEHAVQFMTLAAMMLAFMVARDTVRLSRAIRKNLLRSYRVT